MSDPFENRFLVVGEDATVINVVVGYVDVPKAGMIAQTAETGIVGIGWVFNADETFTSPGGPVAAPMPDYLNSAPAEEAAEA
ncbi:MULTISPECIES: hypothetical protein [unclassified Rhizobium]|uniref:hypothetical protein n=1 Tax=unclassified Rhizobium TaxID=2613769 RepID=UPI00160A3CF9|nr:MULTISPECIES: hypothetical protein [unclassified Rhizobium]MBB3520998.1 hypothetical protein [Rhizobium sp. BK456]MDR6664027.1 hypothetical protein [Rhizobium sp. 1399]